MLTFGLTQALLTVGTIYHVRKPREDAVIYTVRGVLMSPTPKFRLLEGDDGKEIGLLTGNFIKTKYEIHNESSAVIGSLVFPAVAFKKTLTLTLGSEVYEADGGVFRGVFQCKKGDETVVEIAKELSIRDTFSVKVLETIPFQVGLLSAVAIHSRFYEMV